MSSFCPSLYSVRLVTIILTIDRQTDDNEYLAQSVNVSALMGQTLNGNIVTTRLAFSESLLMVEMIEALNLLRAAYVDATMPSPAFTPVRAVYGKTLVNDITLPHALEAIA